MSAVHKSDRGVRRAATMPPLCWRCGNYMPEDNLQADINRILYHNTQGPLRYKASSAEQRQRREIRRRFVAGDGSLSVQDIADEYGVSNTRVREILRHNRMPEREEAL